MSPPIHSSSLDSDPAVQKVPVWKRHSFPQDLAAEISFMEEAHMFWAVWSIPRQLHKPKFLHFGGVFQKPWGRELGREEGMEAREPGLVLACRMIQWLGNC